MPGIGQHRAVGQAFEMLAPQHVAIARGGDHEIRLRHRFAHGRHVEALHVGFQRFARIDFGHGDPRAPAPGFLCHASAAITEARYHHAFARHQQIGDQQQVGKGGFAGAVNVIELGFHRRVVDRIRRKAHGALLVHGFQPQHAGGGLFTGAQ